MKTSLLFQLSAVAILTAFLFTSCSEEEEPEANIGTLTCKIGGETFTAVSFENTLVGDDTGKRFDVRATDASGKTLIVTINDDEPYGTNFSHIGEKVYVDFLKNTPINLATIGTLIHVDQTFFMTSWDGEETGYSLISSSDLSSKRVSGVFEFELVNPFNNEIIPVTEGKYTNVTYISAPIPD